MAVDQLLLIVLFLGIPLLEWLIRMIRTRAKSAPAERVPTTGAKPPVSRPPPARPAARAGTAASEGLRTELPPPVPARPSTVTQAAPRNAPSPRRDRTQGRREPGLTAAAVAVGAPRPRMRHGAARRVIPEGDLRRAVVLMAIFGPCKALAAKDASQPS